MEILYQVHNNLYVNLTNKCPCACTFCLRQTKDHVGKSDSLWLEREPTAEEIIAAFDAFDLSLFEEIVFCGFGEPTEAWEVLKEVASYVKNTLHKPVRVNTNGLGSLINGRDIAPECAGLIDTLSISLNNPNPEAYHALVRSKFKEASFDAMLSFAKEASQYVKNVVLTTVATTISTQEEAMCQELCDSLGVSYRIRPFE